MATLHVAVFAFISLISLGILCTPNVGAEGTVELQTGRLILTTTDLVVQAGAAQIEVARSLQDSQSKRGILGTRWKMNWECGLAPVGNSVLVDCGGQLAAFELQADGTLYRNDAGDRLMIDQQRRFIITRPDGTQDTFDPQGRLTARDLRNGNRISLHYDNKGRLIRIEGPRKSYVSLTYDGTGKVIQIDSSSLRSVRYTYADDYLIEVRRLSDGSTISYRYHLTGQLAREDHPLSGATFYDYDEKGRLANSRFADGTAERCEYDDAANTSRLAGRDGGVTTTRWSQDRRRMEETNPLGHKTIYDFDDRGRLTRVTGPTGLSRTFEYDQLNRLVTTQDEAGRTTRLQYIGETNFPAQMQRSDGAVNEFRYDSQLNLSEMRSNGQRVLFLQYYQDGLVERLWQWGSPEVRFGYDASGRIAWTGDALGNYTRFEHDARGNLIRETNPLGGTTVYGYDERNRLVSVTSPSGTVTRYEYDPMGNVTRVIDPLGGVTQYRYDVMGRRTGTTNSAGMVVTFEYDRAGRLLSVKEGNSTTRVNSYDALGNIVRSNDRYGRTSVYQYDAAGMMVKEKTPTGVEISYEYDVIGNVVEILDSTGARAIYQYDSLDHLVMETDPLGAATRYQYDRAGNLLGITDPRGAARDFTYNPTGLLSSVKQANGDTGRYDYDLAGRMTVRHRPSGGADRLTYDALGNERLSSDPLGNIRQFSYDSEGRVMTQTDATGHTTRFVYDKAGLLSEKHLPDGRKVSYQYDIMGNLTLTHDGQIAVRFVYNSEGRLIKKEYSSLKKAFTYEYDANGMKRRVVDSDGRWIQYEYDSQSRMSQIVSYSTKPIVFSYDVKGRLTTVAYPNGINGYWTYDVAGQVTEVSYRNRKGENIAGWRYVYDAAGNQASEIRAEGGELRFAYDPSGQLVQESTSKGTLKYRYAPGGNRAALEREGSITQYVYDAADRLQQAGSERYTFDKNGRMTSRMGSTGSASYQYDAENRLVRVSDTGTGETTFGYTQTNERAWRSDKKGLSFFLHDGLNLIEELDNHGVLKAFYVHGAGIDRPLAMIRDGEVFYYHADRRGSIKLITDEQGHIVASFDYDAFGNIISQTGNLQNPFGYTAREWEPDIKLYYYRARYYDPQLGRFLSVDPLPGQPEQPLTLNPYIYASNNPTRYSDPLGLSVIPQSICPYSNPGEELWYLERRVTGILLNNSWGEYDPEYQLRVLIRAEELRAQGVTPQKPGPAVAGSGGPQSPGTVVGSARPQGAGTAAMGPGRPQAPGTVAVSPGRPPQTGSTIKVSPPAGGSGPRVTAGGVAGGLGTAAGAASAAINYQACLDEGKSPEQCRKDLAVGVGTGIAVGSLVTLLAPALLATPAAPFVLAGLGAAAVVQSGVRWANAPVVQAQAAQQASQAQSQQRFDNIVANLESQVAAFEKMGRDVMAAVKDVADAADKATHASLDARKNFEALGNASSQVTGQLGQQCVEAQKKLVSLADSAQKAKEYADNALKGFSAIDARLTRCSSQGDLSSADELLRGTTAYTLSADTKYRSALGERDTLSNSINTIKGSVKSLQQTIGKNELNYAGTKKAIDNYVSDANKSAEKARNLFATFTGQRNSLLRSVSNLRGVLPASYHVRISNCETRIKNAQPASIMAVDSHLQRAQKAQSEAAPGASQVLDKVTVDSTLQACGALTTAALDAELGKAGVSVLSIGQVDTRLTAIAGKRKLCADKLGQGTTQLPQPPSPPTTPQKPQTAWRAFGIDPKEVTLKVGESRTFSAYVVDQNGVRSDISSTTRWPKGRTYKATKPGTDYVEVRATLDETGERVDRATVRVEVPTVDIYLNVDKKIATVGEKVTVTATLKGQVQGRIIYKWTVSGATGSKSTTLEKNTLVINATKAGDFTATLDALLVTEGGGQVSLGQRSEVFKVAKSVVSISQDSAAKVGKQVVLTASVERSQGPFTYDWTITGPSGSKQTSLQKNTLTINVTKEGTFNVSLAVKKKLPDGTVATIGTANHTLVATKDPDQQTPGTNPCVDCRVGCMNAYPTANRDAAAARAQNECMKGCEPKCKPVQKPQGSLPGTIVIKHKGRDNVVTLTRSGDTWTARQNDGWEGRVTYMPKGVVIKDGGTDKDAQSFNIHIEFNSSRNGCQTIEYRGTLIGRKVEGTYWGRLCGPTNDFWIDL